MRALMFCLMLACLVSSARAQPSTAQQRAPAETVTVRFRPAEAVQRVALFYSLEGLLDVTTHGDTVTTGAVVTAATDVINTDVKPPASSVAHSEVAYFYRATVTATPGDTTAVVRLTVWERATGQRDASPATVRCVRQPACASALEGMKHHAAKLRRDPPR